jgi:hypothetical protein
MSTVCIHYCSATQPQALAMQYAYKTATFVYNISNASLHACTHTPCNAQQLTALLRAVLQGALLLKWQYITDTAQLS